MFANLNLSKNKASFEVHGVDLSVVNAIRRTILTDIPMVGFRGEDEPSLTILGNNGPLHNEFLLHRISMIPIHFSEEEVEAFTADDYEFELHVENKGMTMLNVTTQDFQILKNGRALPAKEQARLLPANPITNHYVLITRLRPGEHIHVKGKAVQGTSRVHAGFSPVSLCTFSFLQDPELAAKATNVLDKERAYARNQYGDPTSFLFHIECEAGLTPYYLVLKVFEILKNKLERTITELYQEPSSYVSYAPSERGTGFNFSFKNEDDTYGNLLQSLMYNHYIRQKKPTEKGKQVTYVGYVCPHPLEQVMNFNVVIDESDQVHDYVEVLSESCRRILGDLEKISMEWQLAQKHA